MLDVFSDLFHQVKTDNMYKFKVTSSDKLQFSGDLIHLTPKCGEHYVHNLFEQTNDLLQNVKRYSSTIKATSSKPTVSTSDTVNSVYNSLFTAAILSDSDGESFTSVKESGTTVDVTMTNKAEDKTPITLELLYSEIRKTNDLAVKVNAHDKDLVVVKQAISSGFKSTDLAIARIYEDQDFSSNVSKENRVTIGSLKIDESKLPVDRSAWINFLTSKVNSIISELFKNDSNSAPVLMGVAIRSTRLNFKKEFPNFDAIFQNSAQSLAFRRALSQSSRHDTGPFKSIFVSNSVSLATRVRIEVMLALSRYLNSNGFTSHVQTFISRPVIHVKTATSPVARVYTYVDCVKEYSNLFENVDLSSAYRRAGTFFEGTLSRFFVVLSDARAQSQHQQSQNKRPQPSNQSVYGKRRK